MNSKKNGLANLTKKAAAVFGVALAALTGIQANASTSALTDNSDASTIQNEGVRNIKPMPVLKLNPNNPANSRFIAQHESHSSHSSHSSHYSHRSGSMFS